MKKLFYFSNLLTLCLILSVTSLRAQIPTITLHPVADTVCLGSGASFTAGVLSTDTAVHYIWEVFSTVWDSVRNGALYSGATTATITFTPTASMNGYLYRVSAYNGAGMSAHTPSVALRVDTIRSAGVISGLSVVCATRSITLTTTGHDGIWVSSNSSATVSSSGVVTGVTGGTAVISYDASDRCGTYIATHALTVNALTAHATITGSSSVCTTSTISLSSNVAGGAWSTTNGHATVSSSGVVTPVGTGTDTILYINAGICNTDTAMKIISIDAPLGTGTISGLSAVCGGSTITLTTTLTGGTWSTTNSRATVSASGVVTGLALGADTIVYSGSNACGAVSANHLVSVDTINHTVLSGPSSLCSTSSIVITPSIGGGVWSASNGHATVNTSGNVNGVSAGTDIISYIHTGACNTDTATKLVTVESPITAGTISGTSVLCVGSVVSLTASIPGGFWLSNDATIGTVDLLGNVTGRGQGHVVISYIFSNSCGTFTANDTLTVQRTASAITGASGVGIGLTTILSDTAINGWWASSDTSIAKVDTFTGLVHGIAGGMATISYIVTNTCGTSIVTQSITVAGPPSAGVITGLDSVCAGSQISLTSTVAGGTWSVINANGSINSGGVFTGTVGRTKDTVKYTVTNMFGTSVVTKAIYINSAPVITLSSFPAIPSLGTAYTLGATPGGGTWTCSAPSTQVYFISANTIVLLQKDTFNIVYTVTNACGTSKDTLVITLTPDVNGVNQLIGSGVSAITVYPNPSNGAFSVKLAADFNEDAQVTITNMVGEKVKEITIPTNKATQITLTQPAGIYMMSATTAHGTYTSRIVVTK